MSRMNKITKKIIPLILLFIFVMSFIAPIAVLAQTPGGGTDSRVDWQSSPNANYIPTQSKGKTSATGGAVGDVTTCAVGNVLANILGGAIGSAINSGISAVGGIVNQEVPVGEATVRAATTGLTIRGIPVTPSWDGVATCIVNAAIRYISDSTIAWIRSGFQGNPVFVDDPGQLFQDIADTELNSLLATIDANGVLCEPFKIGVQNALVNNRTNNNYAIRGKCTFDDIINNSEDFLNGDFSLSAWEAYTQVPSNNPIGSYLMAEREYSNRVQAKAGLVSLELDWGNGFFSWKDKDDPTKTVTPGKVIETQLAQRLGLDENKLVVADEFDEVITELVNELIKIALTETLGGS